MKIHRNTILIIIIFVCVVLAWFTLPNTNNKNAKSYGTNAVHINQTQNTKKMLFDDGLGSPKDKIGYKTDETGDGITQIETFLYDINTDGKADKITRIHHENGTAHFWDEYTIELNDNDRFRSVSTDDFRTINGAECALQKLKFIFKPKFQVIKISRPWIQSWNTPSVATQTIYELKNNKIIAVETKKLSSVCDVTHLFIK